MEFNYEDLPNVLIIKKEQNQYLTFGKFFGYSDDDEEEVSKKERWIVTYHNKYKKWIVTDDFENCGLKEVAKNVDMVGYADDINSALFILWEHQKALGLAETIFEHIQEKKKKKMQSMDNEWSWGKPLTSLSSSGFKYGSSFKINSSGWGIFADNECEYDEEN